MARQLSPLFVFAIFALTVSQGASKQSLEAPQNGGAVATGAAAPHAVVLVNDSSPASEPTEVIAPTVPTPESTNVSAPIVVIPKPTKVPVPTVPTPKPTKVPAPTPPPPEPFSFEKLQTAFYTMSIDFQLLLARGDYSERTLRSFIDSIHNTEEEMPNSPRSSDVCGEQLLQTYLVSIESNGFLDTVASFCSGKYLDIAGVLGSFSTNSCHLLQSRCFDPANITNTLMLSKAALIGIGTTPDGKIEKLVETYVNDLRYISNRSEDAFRRTIKNHLSVYKPLKKQLLDAIDMASRHVSHVFEYYRDVHSNKLPEGLERFLASNSEQVVDLLMKNWEAVNEIL